ncbi:hydroxymethylglutaryl-CoA lyase [Candidatus Aeolococcus gillhamiae]|uniref:Hydroxymethylglutaryl-CoA lyase n=1 Tax=Candidatus Aeolococcus gillhamiae TaxID=3127015 RepID=A0A2W5Z0X4_9BACT|nr:MAG: hydroxymethylglutaryl-CoA lyase [Candidatus Dormibacter sp. RRmetagenome_bin12]
MAEITWTDVAPRDGLQNISDTVSTEVKVRLIEGLLAAGVPRVEATSFVSPKWVPQLADAAEVLRGIGPAALARLRVLIPNRRGLELALEHEVTNVLYTIGATDTFNRRNVNRSVAESLDDLDAVVGDARQAGCEVDVAVSVSFGCPFEGEVDRQRIVDLCRELVSRGAAEVGIADTIGVAHPAAVRELCARAGEVVPGQRLSLHVHDTRGLGVANVLVAYEAGVTRFDGSAGGLGGCPFAPRSTGNVCSEDALQAVASAGGIHGCDLAAYVAVSQTLAADIGRELPGKLYRAGVWTGPAVAESVA